MNLQKAVSEHYAAAFGLLFNPPRNLISRPFGSLLPVLMNNGNFFIA